MLIGMVAACDGDRQADSATAINRPAGRIITLAPNLTELVYSAGAGNRLVGVVEYSDYPDAALQLPRIGDAFRLDHEAIIELDPDLILAWQSGTPQEVIDRLELLGFRVVIFETGTLDGVADSLRLIGRLADTGASAEAAAASFEVSLGKIREESAGRAPVRVFYQISAHPLFTISRRHIIGEAIELCGGSNVFGDLAGLSPSISLEAVIDAAPEAIIAGKSASEDVSVEKGLNIWRQWASIPAVHDGNLFFVDADLLHRSSVRILGGVRELCARIETARRKRTAATLIPGYSTLARPGRPAGSVHAQSRTAGPTAGSGI